MSAATRFYALHWPGGGGVDYVCEDCRIEATADSPVRQVRVDLPPGERCSWCYAESGAVAS